MTDHRARVDQLLADYRRSREQLADIHQQLGAIQESVSSADGAVTATVGPRGTLIGLTITDEAYRRYRPAELAEEIVRVTASATMRALSAASDAVAPALPAGTDPEALLLGTGDLGAEDLRPEASAGNVRPTSAGEHRAGPESTDEDDYEAMDWLVGGGGESR